MSATTSILSSPADQALQIADAGFYKQTHRRIRLCRCLCPFFGFVFVLLGAAFELNGFGPPLGSQDMITDRPDITESGIVVPKGSLQFENGFTWADERTEHVLDLSETLARVGLTDRTEVRFVIPTYTRATDVLTRTVSHGFTDMGLGLKQQLGPLGGSVELAIILGIPFLRVIEPSRHRDLIPR